jgi:hypothetical protein
MALSLIKDRKKNTFFFVIRYNYYTIKIIIKLQVVNKHGGS